MTSTPSAQIAHVLAFGAPLAYARGEHSEVVAQFLAAKEIIREQQEVAREFIAADELVSRIYDEASPGLNTPRPQDHYDRLGKAIERRVKAYAALESLAKPLLGEK